MAACSAAEYRSARLFVCIGGNEAVVVIVTLIIFRFSDFTFGPLTVKVPREGHVSERALSPDQSLFMHEHSINKTVISIHVN